MHVEDLKRWHWIAISLVVGLGLAYAYSGIAADGGPGSRRTIGPGEFFRQLGRVATDKSGERLPLVRNIRVYPPVEGKNLVTLEELVITTDRTTGARTGEYQPRQFVAEIPFTLNRQTPPGDQWTIRDELARRQRTNPAITYRYVATAAPTYVYGIAVGASFLLIGVIWPTLLGRLQQRGYGAPARAPAGDADKYDLSKARSGSGRKAPPPTKKGPTQADLDQLRQVTARYEQNVAGMTAGVASSPSPAGATVAEASKSTAQRSWDAKPLEEVKPQTLAADDDEVEVKGEYYPVLIHHKKPHDPEKPAGG